MVANAVPFCDAGIHVDKSLWILGKIVLSAAPTTARVAKSGTSEADVAAESGVAIVAKLQTASPSPNMIRGDCVPTIIPAGTMASP